MTGAPAAPRRPRVDAGVRAIACALLLACGAPAHAAGRRVVLVVVDGLDARTVDAAGTPNLDRLWREASWCPSLVAEAAMPARTNVNHATLTTGVQPDVHGIIGNAFWDRVSPAPRKLGAAGDFLTETVFGVAHQAARPLRTGVAVGKGKLALMFTATAGGSAAPDALWAPDRAASAERDPQTGYALDAATLAGARGLLADAHLDFLLVNLAEVDLASHRFGPRSSEAAAVRRRTDAAIGDFVRYLAGDAGWAATTVVITADHGFDTVTAPPLRFEEAVRAAGLKDVVAVGDGGVDHVYVRGREAERDATLEKLHALALRTPGIAEALFVLAPSSTAAATTLAGAHPDWHLVHPRSGDLLLVAEPGHVLVDGDPSETRLRGNHGGPGDRQVPLIVVHGGTDRSCEHVGAADVGRTIIACLGLRDVRRLDGGVIADGGRGRLLSGFCPDDGRPPT